MKIGRIENFPWYQTIPALASLLLTAGILLSYWGYLPDTVAIHFNASGQPDNYGAKENLLILLAAAAVLALIDCIVRYQMLLHQRRKTWMILLLLPSPILALIPWAAYETMIFNAGHGTVYFGSQLWMLVSLIAVFAVFLIITEKYRPVIKFVPGLEPLSAKYAEGAASKAGENELLNASRFCFIERTNSIWLSLIWPVLTALIVLLPAPVALHHGASIYDFLIPLAVVLLVFLVIIGGFTAVITPEAFIVRGGFLGIRLANVPLKEIVGVETAERKKPVRGWMCGWRYGMDGSVCFSAGGSKILKVSTQGGDYIFTSDRADAMAKAINDARSALNTRQQKY